MFSWGLIIILAWKGICLAQEKEPILLDNQWLIQAQRADESAMQWLKEHLKERLASENFLNNPLEIKVLDNSSKGCQACGTDNGLIDESASLYVFMSFSLDDQLWLQLSKELEAVGGIFVLRGLPQNSFKELANRLFALKEKGVTVPIQIHPKLFQEYEIQLVPTIVVADDTQYDKLSGNVSLRYALEKMAQSGETHQAKVFNQKLNMRAKP